MLWRGPGRLCKSSRSPNGHRPAHTPDTHAAQGLVLLGLLFAKVEDAASLLTSPTALTAAGACFRHTRESSPHTAWWTEQMGSYGGRGRCRDLPKRW